MFDVDSRPTDQELKKLVLGELSLLEAKALRARLRDDLDAQQRYDRLVRAERALEGQSDASGLGAGGTDRVRTRLFEQPPTPTAWTGWLRWPMLMTAATAAVFAAVALTTIDPAPPTEEFRSRSGAALRLSSDFVLQVLHVAVDAAGQVEIHPASDLQVGDALRFAAFVRADSCRLSVLAVDATGRRQVLLDRVNVIARPTAQRLDLALQVPEEWSGPVRFVGVFETSKTAADLATVDIAARDSEGVAVRVVRTRVGGSD